jgi:hypothetical protein
LRLFRYVAVGGVLMWNQLLRHEHFRFVYVVLRGVLMRN